MEKNNERRVDVEYILPATVTEILDRLEKNGFRADVVGGPTRDLYLGMVPSDYDITTSATPEEIKSTFSSERTVDTGIRHGTVTLVMNGENYEITTYRIDGEYRDSRRPENVTFTKYIEDDLARRDFTMNAMAYSPRHGITDPYGAREDIDRHLIRTVGDPRLRFGEDALRMLRALRFSAKLGFHIDDATRVAIFELWQSTYAVSRERVFAELKKLIESPFAYSVLREYGSLLAGHLSLESLRLPEEECFNRVGFLPRLLYLYAGSSTDFRAAMTALHTDSALRESGSRILSRLGKFDLGSEEDILFCLSKIGENEARDLIRLSYLLGKCDLSPLDTIDSIIAQEKPYRLSHLKVHGNDLIPLGLRGSTLGRMLSRLLEAVIRGECENEKESLLEMARSLLL